MKMKTRREKLESISFATNVNLGLWLDKFIGGQNIDGVKEEKNDEKFKSKLINEATQIKSSNEYKVLFERRQENLAQIEPNLFKAIKIDSRMIIGLGGESVWENAISIHRTYGVPFISGSSLKGLAASYAHKFIEGWAKNAEPTLELEKGEKVNLHQFVFGSQESAGFITFHDALLFPDSKNVLHADIMTVHHQDYYSDGTKPPADWDSPTPINFISASGEYLLALTTLEGGEKWLEITAQILENAFKDEGIGAKTSSGYGRATLTDNFPKTAKMKELEDERKRAEDERKLAESARRKEEIRLAEERSREEKRLAWEAEQQAKLEQKRQGESSKVQNIFRQIAALDANKKKIEKEFEKITKAIYKLDNTEHKKQLAAAVLEKMAQLQSVNVKIDVSRKWFKTLKKLKGEN